MNASPPLRLVVERTQQIFQSFRLSSETLAHIILESAQRGAGLLIETRARFLGHSCVAVLALQGGIYNVCGMYNV